MAWPTYCTESALTLEPLLSDKIRTPTDTHACAETHTSAHTHAHVHAELSLHDKHPRMHSLTGKYIYAWPHTNTHALCLSEQILASHCGLIVCQVSILHLCILHFYTQSHKAKKKTTARASVQTHPGSGAYRIANATKPWLLRLFYRQMSKYLSLFLFKAISKSHGFHMYHSMLKSHTVVVYMLLYIFLSSSIHPHVVPNQCD